MSEDIPEMTTDSGDETRKSHELYLRAVDNPLRRKILCALKENDATLSELMAKTCLDEFTLKWHLNILESGRCVEKEDRQGSIIYKLTKEGKVIDYIE